MASTRSAVSLVRRFYDARRRAVGSHAKHGHQGSHRITRKTKRALGCCSRRPSVLLEPAIELARANFQTTYPVAPTASHSNRMPCRTTSRNRSPRRRKRDHNRNPDTSDSRTPPCLDNWGSCIRRRKYRAIPRRSHTRCHSRTRHTRKPEYTCKNRSSQVPPTAWALTVRQQPVSKSFSYSCD